VRQGAAGRRRAVDVGCADGRVLRGARSARGRVTHAEPLTDDERAALEAIDPRIVDGRGLWGEGLGRVRLWLSAGMPPPDLYPLRLSYAGDDRIELMVLALLAKVPTPVAWFAVENLTFVGLGAGKAGLCGAPPLPPPAGRAARLIMLAFDDEEVA